MKSKILKLTELSKREMNSINGGTEAEYGGYVWNKEYAVVVPTCGCACAYSDKGGSSTADNKTANVSSKLFSKGTEIIFPKP